LWIDEKEIMQEFDYLRPETISELKKDLSSPGAKILAGGTDIVPKMRNGQFSAAVLVDPSRVSSLRFIEDRGNKIVIGSLTTHQELAESIVLRNVNPALAQAAETIGCVQTRSRGTLGGNIANASPAGDTIPPLLIYDAEILLQSQESERIVALDDLVLGPGETGIKDGEFINNVSFSPLVGSWGSAFLKVGKRSGMAISVVNGAAAILLDENGLIKDVRIALGAVGPKVIRCRITENSLLGQEPSMDLLKQVSISCREEISPISDVRSNEKYRLLASGVIARRVLEEALEQARRRSN
jgi:CO/xanthine dehydrogenase FAD-binding subunit